jgi:hypothetical protein
MFPKNFRNSIQFSSIQFLKNVFHDKHQAYDTPSLGGLLMAVQGVQQRYQDFLHTDENKQ